MKNFFLRMYVLLFWFFRKTARVEVLSDDITADHIIHGGYSISRYGDGEIVYCFGFHHMWQKKSKELRRMLRLNLKSSDSKCMVCIPDFLYSKKKRKKIDPRSWRLPKYCFDISIRSKLYGSAFLFRPLNALTTEPQYVTIARIRKLLNYFSSKKIIYIGTDNCYKKYISPSKILSDIPLVNAFENYNQILSMITHEIQGDKDNYLILISCGLTATLLAKDLSNFGVQSLDIGSFFSQLDKFTND